MSGSTDIQEFYPPLPSHCLDRDNSPDHIPDGSPQGDLPFSPARAAGFCADSPEPIQRLVCLTFDASAVSDSVPWMIYSLIRFVPSLIDRKSTRLNSSHVAISYAVFCL